MIPSPRNRIHINKWENNYKKLNEDDMEGLIHYFKILFCNLDKRLGGPQSRSGCRG
jgi:hypothetical protein